MVISLKDISRFLKLVTSRVSPPSPLVASKVPPPCGLELGHIYYMYTWTLLSANFDGSSREEIIKMAN